MEYELREFADDFSGEVRLFALPNLVMFPCCVQPLHIFESRYREMFEDAIQGDLLIAMATLLPGYKSDYYSRPPISEHVCIGQVVMHEKTPKGTYNLVLVGQRRAEIQHEITPVRSYRRAAVKIIEDEEPAKTTGDQLRDQIMDRLEKAGDVGKRMHEIFRRGAELSMMTDVVAFNLLDDSDLKLRLLSESDPLARARVLLDSDALRVEDPPESRASFPPPFGNN